MGVGDSMDLQTFKKSKDFLVCIDSDGCAIDSMNIKHQNKKALDSLLSQGLDVYFMHLSSFITVSCDIGDISLYILITIFSLPLSL